MDEVIDLAAKAKIIKYFNYAGQPNVYEQELHNFFVQHKFLFNAMHQPNFNTGDIVICKFIESTTVLNLGQKEKSVNVNGSRLIQLQMNLQVIVSCHIVYYNIPIE